MEIFATGLSSPETPIILDSGDLLTEITQGVVEVHDVDVDGLPIFW